MLTTPLHAEHEKLGASFTDFGGWSMPVRYGSDLEEHHQVRNSAGIFDISHMAEIRIRGEQAAAASLGESVQCHQPARPELQDVGFQRGRVLFTLLP